MGKFKQKRKFNGKTYGFLGPSPRTRKGAKKRAKNFREHGRHARIVQGRNMSGKRVYRLYVRGKHKR